MTENENREQEQKIFDKIRQAVEEEPVPESLEPEKIEQILSGIKREKRIKRMKKYIPACAAAACICLVAGIGTAGGFASLSGGSTGNGRKSMDSASSSGSSGSSGQESAAASEVPDSGNDAGETTSDLPEENRLVCAGDYYEIYGALKKSSLLSGGDAIEESGAESANGGSASNFVPQQSASDMGEANKTYTNTNIREEGVEEGDVVRTDGENLYILSNMTVEIVGIGSGILEEKGEIPLPEDAYMAELYVKDGRLLVVYTESVYSEDETTGFYGYFRNRTYSAVYDVSDPSSPERLGSISQSGAYNTMRVSEDYVYVLSDYFAESDAAQSNVSSYVPEVQGEILPAEDIYMPFENSGNHYTVITAFSLNDPTEKTDSRAVFGNGGICYVSADSIYVTEEQYVSGAGDTNQTSIRKISYKDGQLEGVAQTKIDGVLKDSFCIDEYDGNLRLVTTVTAIVTQDEEEDTGMEQSNTLCILDDNLREMSRIEDIAQDEQVYSARFMGDTGYFVTFRQTDPLFSVDLSDPEEPRIIGELKIPGFSEYLHPYGDGLLLGIGMATDDEGVTTTGVKLSMFDVSDPADVKEADSLVLEEMYFTVVAYNYKAAYADDERGLFGFLACGDDQIYYIFTYDKDQGFRKVFERTINSSSGARGLRIGEIFYLVSENTVESYDINGYSKIDDIVL